MMRTLFSLELHRQKPFIAFALLLAVVLYMLEGVMGPPHEATLGHLYADIGNSEVEAWFTVFLYSLLTLALAHAVYSREFIDGTVEWLDAMPASRGRVFTAKLLAACTVLTLLMIFLFTPRLVIEWTAADSLNTGTGAHVLWLSFFLELVLIFSLFGYSVALAQFGFASWVLLVAVLLGAGVLA